MGVLAILCALVSPIVFFGEERGAAIYWGRFLFFVLVAFVMFNLATEKEISLHKGQGMLEFVEKKPFSMPASKKYRVSELRQVKYYGSPTRLWAWGGSTGFQPAAIDFFFKDGTKAGGFVRINYVPRQNEFPGVKIEYIY